MTVHGVNLNTFSWQVDLPILSGDELREGDNGSRPDYEERCGNRSPGGEHSHGHVSLF